MKPEMKAGDLQRFIDHLAARAGDNIVSMGEQSGADGQTELFLTIENTIEDRAKAYMRLLRMRQVVRKSRG
jgi:hypothetical protein